MCKTTDNLTVMCLEHVNEQISEYEDRFSDFANIYADKEIPACCKTDEIASRYGWGSDAVNAWEDYTGLRYLRGDD